MIDVYSDIYHLFNFAIFSFSGPGNSYINVINVILIFYTVCFYPFVAVRAEYVRCWKVHYSLFLFIPFIKQ